MTIFKSHLYDMGAYKPPLEGRDPHSYLLLDFNERTLPVGDAVREALIAYINAGRLQMYPSYGDIVERIAAYAKVPAEQVMITNGSDQGIDLVFRATCAPGDEVIIPQPSFAIYEQIAKVEGQEIISPFYTKEGGYPVKDVMVAITDKTRLIVVSNPNNPCGTLVSRSEVLALAKAAPEAAILVDECYFEYSKTTVSDLVAQYPNIVITRTFSKTWGIPSLRLGYVVSAPANIKALLNVRGPYDVNQLAIVAANAVLDDTTSVEAYVTEVMDEAKPMLEGFLDRVAIPYWRSGANFIWMFPEDAAQVEEGLRKAGILVRPKADEKGRMGLRITIGTLEQTERLISVLGALLPG
ncbi:histidinol-phosphate transaminase [Teredinibacter sp. KSP-S5-2]|uniref:pyridoxal phosphate-dependent aminotransferase n=1 Tax=Teredinibacter sp. KSP-S5-2 TaxID=3034506 RepID=UPI0029343F55|nr:histidinol-phosphate transaminase [Teredinibacter sp. KSP-S5-2]WNO09761.1 histidinol-phosphate transaminase [Teredinibacter sp. KSP-S5-2]